MNEAKRHRLITDRLRKQQVISMQEVMDLLNVSLSTARRDILKMDELGLLRKIRNGAEALNTDTNTPTGIVMPGYPTAHTTHNYEEKLEIAKAASKLCEDNDTVIINGSNTTCLMAEYLVERPVQIITNYLPLSCFLITQSKANLVLLGGQYISERYITISTEEELNLYTGRYVFITGSGLTSEGLHTTDLLVFSAVKELLKRGQNIVVMVDSSKVGAQGGRLLAEATNIDVLITGRDAEKSILDGLREQGVEVITV